MDYATFEQDVWQDVNEGTYDEQGETEDGVIVTIGETWQGALYGAEENDYGQRAVYLFDDEEGQRDWYDAMVAGRPSMYI